VNATGEAVYLDFAAAIIRYGKEKAHVKGLNENDESLVKELGKEVVKAKYGNLFQMYEKIVDENPYETPMMIYPSSTLYYGWYLGRLQFNDNHSWIVTQLEKQIFLITDQIGLVLLH